MENQQDYTPAVRDDVLVPSWERMKEQAAVLHKSGFFPKSIKSSEAAIAIMLAGRELGLGPMESLRSVYIVDGQTTISSGLMAAMIWDAGHGYEILESTDKVCRIKFWRMVRTGLLFEPQYYTHEYTIDEAKKANLLGKFNWKAYPKAMLFNRCISSGGRAFMPDVTRKMYTPEEMGAPVTVSESGDVVIDVVATVIEEIHPGGAEWTKTVNWASFWIHWKDKGISHAEMRAAAGVESMKDYTGTKDELKAAVDAYIAAQIEAGEDAPAGEAASVQKDMNDLGFGNVQA